MIKKIISLTILSLFVVLIFVLSSGSGFKHRFQTGAVALAGQDEKILNKTFELRGSNSELTGTSDGSVVTPSVGPKGVVKVRGQGSVNFSSTSSGNGVYFEKGNTQNDNTAFYLFRGSDVVNLVDYAAGEISFTLKSRYTYNERLNLPTYYKYRTPFSIEDLSQSDPASIVFYTEPTQFTFYFRGVNINKPISQKEFESYFDKDKELKVRLVWGDSTCSIYLNDALYYSKSCPTSGQISSNSLMSIGASKPSSYGGGWWANDDILSDFSINKYVSVDKRGPEISSVLVKEDVTSAIVSWQTNEDSTGDVDYGTLLSYGKSVSSQNPSKNHSVSITGLLPGTFYNFIIRAKDLSGNISKTTNASILTKTANQSDPVVPVNNNNNTNNNSNQVTAIVSNSSNKITLKEISGQVQSNRVFSISRVFKEGDITNFPQARISGNTLTTQADVKNRWPDGSVKHAILSFITTLPANSSVDVDFVNQSSCNCGSGLSSSEMLSSKYNLDASMTLSPGGTVSAKDIIKSGNFRYWLSGPIVTQVIAEDRSPSRSFDLTFGNYKSFHPIFIVSFYPSDSNIKVDFIGENAWTDALQDIKYSVSLNLDGKTLYSKSDFVHAYSTRWRKTFSKVKSQDVQIDHNLAYLASTKAIPNFDTSIRATDESISDAVNKPWNSQCSSPSWIEAVRTGKTDIGGPAQVCTSMPAQGGRPDLGVIPGWYARYLYAMSSNNPLVPKLYDALIGNADASGSIRMHYREALSDRKFSRSKNDSAFGKTLSLDARPGYVLIGPQSDAGVGDGISFVQNGSISGASFIQPEINHFPSLVYVPYLLTGDYYFLEQQYMSASYSLGVASRFDGYRVRNKVVNGILGYYTENRGLAWAMREIGQAAFIAPDNSPEKEYYNQMMINNIAALEGVYNVTNGQFYNPKCSTSPFNPVNETNPWCYGNKAETWSGQIGQTKEKMNMIRNENPLRLTDAGGEVYSSGPPTYKTGKVLSTSAMWMWGYNWNVWGMLADMGFPIRPLLNSRLEFLLNLLAHPDAVPQIIASYTIPTRNADGKLIQSVKEFVDSYEPAELQRMKTNNFLNATDGQSGYSNIIRAAASYLPSGVTSGNLRGQDGWNVIDNALSKYRSAFEYDQTWAIVPRYTQSQQVVNVVTVPENKPNPIIEIVEKIISPIIDTIIPSKVETPAVTPPVTTTPPINTQPVTNTPSSNTTSNLTISSIKATKNSPTEVVVTWNTNLESDSNVEYRYSVGQGKWAYDTIFNTNRSTSHSVVLKKLKPDTIYYYKVWSKDRNGRTSYSAERIFNTISQ